jgi:ADP-dependent NAD(P)H-hydrate dehydratase
MTRRVSTALLRRWPLPAIDGTLGKEERGKLLLIAGSEANPGAALLAGVSALRAGAGTLEIATARRLAPAVAVSVPEARVIGLPTTRRGEIAGPGVARLGGDVDASDAVLLGPGMTDPASARALLALWRRRSPKATLVLDAGALEALDTREFTGVRVLTPHAGEMAKLHAVDREQVLARPEAFARSTAAALTAVVVLKGPRTHIAGPDGECYENTAGNPGLGTSGSGDVLAGVIAGLCARGAEPLQAAVWGVHLHARAGELLARRIGPLGFLARELADEVPPLLVRLGRRTR